MNEYELYHHGIKGQKWGIRRTAAQLGHRVVGAAKTAGKAVGKGVSKAGKVTGKVISKGATKAKKAAVASAKQHYAEAKEKNYYKKLHKKKLSQMTDKEIKDLTDRVKREASLKDAKYEYRAQNARKFYNNVAKQPLNDFLSKYSQAAIKDAFKDTSKEATRGKGVENSTVKGKTPLKLKDRNKNSDSGNDVDFEVVATPQKKKDNPVIIRHETPSLKITDEDITRYDREQQRNADASIRTKSNTIVAKSTGKAKIGSDFDSYFEREVQSQWKKDHGVDAYSTDGMTTTEIRKDQEYRKRMGLPEREYKKRVMY